MNERRALRALAGLIALSLAFFVAACHRDPGPPPLEDATMGGPFTLTDQDGRRVSDTDFAGKYRLIYFGYTFCPDVCPTDLAMIGAAMRRLESTDPDVAAKVQPIFISVDPARDTPAVLKRYVAAFYPRLIGLTGSEEEIARVAREYAVYYHREPPQPGAAPDQYLVDHSRMAVLYGPDNKPIAIMPDDQGPDGIAQELKRWVR
jgi:protein SCO1/2